MITKHDIERCYSQIFIFGTFIRVLFLDAPFSLLSSACVYIFFHVLVLSVRIRKIDGACEYPRGPDAD